MLRRIAIISGLLLVALPALPARAGGSCRDGHATEGTGATVTMGRNCYTPTVLRTEPGTAVTFQNLDPEPHTVTAAAGTWGDSHQEVAPDGGRMKIRFDGPGVYAYTCLIHPGMTGAIVVGDGTRVGKGAEIIAVDEAPTDLPASPVRADEPIEPPSGMATTAMALGAALPALMIGYVFGRRRRQV